jgi:hypothetical protein
MGGANDQFLDGVARKEIVLFAAASWPGKVSQPGSESENDEGGDARGVQQPAGLAKPLGKYLDHSVHAISPPRKACAAYQ